MKPESIMLIAALGLAWWYFTKQAPVISSGGTEPGASGPSGGTCPGSPGCPGNLQQYQTNWGVTVTGPVSGGTCPGTPGCPGYVAPEYETYWGVSEAGLAGLGWA